MRITKLGALVGAALLVALPLAAEARTLTVGTSGTDVKALQTQLITKGYLAAGSNTGTFGPLTLAAVKKFQCAQNIVCSGSSYGIAGPATQAALGVAASSGTATTNTTPVGASTATAPAGVVAGADPSQQGVLTGKSLTAAYKGPLEFSGWVPDWRADAAAADTTAHLSSLTSIMPFGYKVNGAGQIAGDFQPTIEPWKSLIANAKAKKVRVVPTVEWGDGATIQAVLSNTTKRIALEDEIANIVKANNFDGIDIDFEAKQSATRDYFSTFLKGLYARMGNKFVYCTIESRQPLLDRYLPGETIPPDALDYANDYSAMNKYCDRVEIMAYDQGIVDHRLDKARSAPYAPVADPGWTGDLIQLAAQSIAKNKLVLGVATYGYEYAVTPKGDGTFDYQVQWAFNPKYGTDLAAQLGITPRRTSANEIGFTYDPSKLTDQPTGTETTQTQQTPDQGTVGNQGSQVSGSKTFNYVTWSDAQAIADKVAQAREYGIRGVAVFSLGGAEDPAMWSVLK